MTGRLEEKAHSASRSLHVPDETTARKSLGLTETQIADLAEYLKSL